MLLRDYSAEVDSAKVLERTKSLLKQLEELDPMRKQRYRDLGMCRPSRAAVTYSSAVISDRAVTSYSFSLPQYTHSMTSGARLPFDHIRDFGYRIQIAINWRRRRPKLSRNMVESVR
jgi:hypothetical protein